ncbi:exported hypothetical protein [Candidatus Terasakiella magnetica]|uniref:Outer membrane protein beta-barrel domain-containing protein n=1 Tax=Candidatus Terasakiella magnetica TaxID=1867952 RepID=A0A1C3RI59_9PROT|nr:hypothetical protein [Candidatus Terasakiella magnetica]SCA56956.1 exported hypothetical protein [Candidatus Terasakiella magnetica]
MLNKKNALILSTVAWIGMPALAQAEDFSKNFEGFNVSLGASLQSSEVDTTQTGNGTWDAVVDSSPAGAWTNGSNAAGNTNLSGVFSYDKLIQWPSTDQAVLPELEINYNFAVSDKFLIGLSAGTDFMKKSTRSDSTRTTSSVTGGRSDNDGSGGGGAAHNHSYDLNPSISYDPSLSTSDSSVDISKHFFLALKPAYTLTKDTMVFAKVGYHVAQAAAGEYDATIHGPGIGGGFESNVGNGFFLRGEIEAYQMSGTTSDNSTLVSNFSSAGGTSLTSFTPVYADDREIEFDTSTIAGKVSLGYRF